MAAFRSAILRRQCRPSQRSGGRARARARTAGVGGLDGAFVGSSRLKVKARRETEKTGCDLREAIAEKCKC